MSDKFDEMAASRPLPLLPVSIRPNPGPIGDAFFDAIYHDRWGTYHLNRRDLWLRDMARLAAEQQKAREHDE